MALKNRLSIFFLLFILPLKVNSMTFYLNNYSARASAMGEAFSSIGDESDVIFFNPASLVNIKANSFQYTMADIYGMGIRLDTLAYASHLGTNNGVIGIAYSIISSGEQEITDVYRYPDYGGWTGEGMVLDSSGDPAILGYFSQSKSAFYLSYGRFIFNKFAAGISFKRYAYFYDGDRVNDKYINALIHTKANCWSLDVGVYWNIINNFILSGTVLDIFNTGFKWNTEYPYTINIDRRVTIGASYEFIKDLSVSIDFSKILGCDKLIFKSGIEYIFKNLLPLRVGYNNKNFNLGSGIILDSTKVLQYIFNTVPSELKEKYLKIDYALLFNSTLGNTHKISFSLDF